MYRPKPKLVRHMMPRLFDVSLRDGIQTASPLIYTTEYKKAIFNRIIREEKPNAIEIGSLVSSKVLPVMQDSLEMFAHARDQLEKENLTRYIPIYMLIPSFEKFPLALRHGVENFSFITSVSEKFQYKNTRKTLCENKRELASLSKALELINPYFGSKLYISCINDCPIEGKMRNNLVAHEIYHYVNNYKFGEYCLSDTCGTLSFMDYVYILDTLMAMGVSPDILSLHLHVGDENKTNVRKIIDYSLSRNVNKFDVSDLETGGCSVTMNKNKCNPNLSYDYIRELMKTYVV